MDEHAVNLIIDQICDRFEKAWREGSDPHLDEFAGLAGELGNLEQQRLIAELSALEAELKGHTAVNDRGMQTVVPPQRRTAGGQESPSAQSVRKSESGEPDIPHSLGEYDVLELIGQGGMGRVFRARHRRMKRMVALKTLPSALVNSVELERRFQREVEAVAHLDHPNIVTAFDAGEDQGIHFLVMQYVDGSDLASVLKHSEKLPLRDALAVVIQAARGLAYAHDQGVIHRDIKPANLLWERSGQVKILDMGLARFNEKYQADGEAISQLTNHTGVMGTVDYMAPEQAVDPRNADHRSDIYSLGCTLYHLASGSTVFGGDTMFERLMAHQNNQPPSIGERVPGLPPQMNDILSRMLAKRPEERFESMNEVVTALQSVLEQASDQQGVSPDTAWGVPPQQPTVSPVSDDLWTVNEGVSPSSRLNPSRHPESTPFTLLQPAERSAQSGFRALVIGGTLLVMSLVSVTLAYRSPWTTDAWLQQFDALTGTMVEGYGFEIECLRAFVYIASVVFISWWKFSREISLLFGRGLKKRAMRVAQVLFIVVSLLFGAVESVRHLSIHAAPADLLATQGIENPTVEQLVAERNVYAAYLPYSLINYMLMVPMLVIFPLTALLNDFPKLSSQQKQLDQFVKRSSPIPTDKQIFGVFQKFEANCQTVCAKYLDFLMLLLIAVHFECWFGRFTLTPAAFGLMLVGWFLVAVIAVGCFIWLFSLYFEAQRSALEELVNRESGDCVRFRNEHNAASFLHWLLTGRISGVLSAAMSILLFVWLVVFLRV